MAAPMKRVLCGIGSGFAVLSASARQQFSTTCITRTSAAKEPKRFYKQVQISQADSGYEINLDKSKLRTPLGNVFRVPTEALAVAVATEWSGQDTTIKRHTMHLTALCNTAIENPTQRTKEQIADGILHFLETDTVCYRMDEPPELVELQALEWDPLVEWFQKRYDVPLSVTTGLSNPPIPTVAMESLKKHLLSYGDWALYGFQFAVEAVKSLVITLGVVDKHISVEKAVSLSRLEEEYQIAKWGNVEWHHDIDLYELRSRLAAATLFVNMCSESTSQQMKLDFNKGRV